MNKTKRFAPSQRITVRWHADEIKQISKGMKKHKIEKVSDYIRYKTLTK